MWNHKEQTLEDILTKEIVDHSFELILYNDDYNTFDHVIDCLVKYCKHDVVQAEQCAWIVHSKGKCSVKQGAYSDLEPKCTALCDNGLNAKIELI